MFETGFREDKKTLEGALEQAKIYSMGLWDGIGHQSHHFGWDWGNNSLVMP